MRCTFVASLVICLSYIMFSFAGLPVLLHMYEVFGIIEFFPGGLHGNHDEHLCRFERKQAHTHTQVYVHT